MRIKVVVWTYEKVYSAYADDATKELRIDGVSVPYTPEFTQQAIGIVKDWPAELDDYPNGGSRGKVYKVTYNDGTTERTMTGNHKTPENFWLLMELIDDYNPYSKKEKDEVDVLIQEYLKKKRLEMKNETQQENHEQPAKSDNVVVEQKDTIREGVDWDDVWY